MTRVLVTGGAGFIGHHVVAALTVSGADVAVLDNLRRGSFERPGLERARLIRGDIRDGAAVAAALRGCDVVVHLAAQSNVLGSSSDPGYAFTTNVGGTWEVAEAARAAGVSHLIFASSREVYGECPPGPVHEDSPLGARNLYGSTKIAGESMLRATLPGAPAVSVVRLANVVGTGDSGRVVPLWLTAALADEPLVLYGGTQVLDFVPVETVVAAVIRLVLGGPVPVPVNVGSGQPVSLRELASRVLEATGSSSPTEVRPARAEEVTRFVADTGRMERLLALDPPRDPLSVLGFIAESLR